MRSLKRASACNTHTVDANATAKQLVPQHLRRAPASFFERHEVHVRGEVLPVWGPARGPSPVELGDELGDVGLQLLARQARDGRKPARRARSLRRGSTTARCCF